ncbi:unnamed protein product [Cladocopium goreaui]|uniref:Uncharacterized protein n=1 Tax=Cladocopium goreaui TaxID=2562237 RepID=A0A9P1GS69_9DINO|nr:unnamed protein product [Cladocopium goreaui]
MALRGIRRTLRSAQRIAPSAVQGLAEALHATASTARPGELGLMEASLCVNELARKKSTIDFAEVPQETWEQIVRSCVQIMPMLPARNLTLLINALAHLSSAAPREPWADLAVQSLLKVPVGGFSAQDLCLTLSAMVRISCTRQDLLSRLLRDDSPPLLGDLEARGTAAFAHAAAQLPTPEVAQLLEQLRPKLQRFAAQGFRPLEVALTLDALSRLDASWAEEAISEMEEHVLRVLSKLKPVEVVMVTSAFSRRNILKSTELARQLTKSIAESFEKCNPAEVCILLHSMARLEMLSVPLEPPSPEHDLVLAMLEHLCPERTQGLKMCSLDHIILLIHALAKLLVRPPKAYWIHLEQRLGTEDFDRGNAVRLSLAAAKLDYKSHCVRQVFARAVCQGPLTELSDEAFASIVLALLHAFYFNEALLERLLIHGAQRAINSQSLALQLRTALIAFLGRRHRRLGTLRALRTLEAQTAECDAWKAQMAARPSPLQLDVHLHTCASLNLPASQLHSEVLLWPFSIDALLWTKWAHLG